MIERLDRFKQKSSLAGHDAALGRYPNFPLDNLQEETYPVHVECLGELLSHVFLTADSLRIRHGPEGKFLRGVSNGHST